jgi:WD40 repeat protein
MNQPSRARSGTNKHVILFLAANPSETGQLALDREARSIHVELKRSGHRDSFDFVTRWATEPLDLLRELRALKPTIVHFSGHGRHAASGLYFHAENGGAQMVPPEAIAQAFAAAGTQVKLVVLNACYSAPVAAALLAHVDCVIGMSGAIQGAAARSFAIGFYGGLGEHESVTVAFAQGVAAIHLEGLPDADQPQLKTRAGVDAGQILLATGASPRKEVPCPYPGMRSFVADDASSFHGRDAEVADLIGRLRAGEREILVIGPSGSGKSSLVTAGLLPRLARGVTGLGPFVVCALRPGEQPTTRLQQALDAPVGEPLVAADRVAALIAHRGPSAALLLVIDQLEELFTLATAEERARFVDALDALRAEPRCAVVLTLRADFFGALMESAWWAAARGQLSRVEVSPLRGDALRNAIAGPAHSVGVTVEPALIERLVADTAAEPGILPLLQETLVALWDVRADQTLTLAAYQSLGDGERSGLAVALARRADATLRRLTVPETAIARRILLRLISFGGGRSDTRQQQPRSRLCASAEEARVLDQLIEHRLLTSDDDEPGEPHVDLAHEVMIGAWPTLAGWVQRHRADEQRRRELEAAAARWAGHGCGARGLLDAVELGEAERWISGDTARDLGYSDELPRFLAASRTSLDEAEQQQRTVREERERERQAARDERLRLRRRLARFAIAALAAFSLVASILGLLAWRQREEARRQREEARRQREEAHGQLARDELELGRSLLVEHDDPSAAVPHLVAAIDLGIDNTVLRTLLAEARHGAWGIAIHNGGPVMTAVFSPDGTRVVTAGLGGPISSGLSTVRIWDATTGAPVGHLITHDQAVSAAVFNPDGTRIVTAVFSPDGTRIVTAGYDDMARVWDARTGEPLSPPLRHRDVVRCAAFSPDGTRVVTSSADGTVQIWDAVTGEPRGRAFGHHQPVHTVEFSPDGTRVVSASKDGTARIWSTDGQPIGRPLAHANAVHTARFSPDGSRIVTTARGGTNDQAWDATSGRYVGEGVVQVWNAETGAPLGPPLDTGRESTASFSLDGRYIVTSSHDGTARVWDAATGNPRGPLLRSGSAVNTAAFSPDGSRVVTASANGTAMVWDAVTGVPLSPPLKQESNVFYAAFSPDGNRVITASDDGTARIWDTPTEPRSSISLSHSDPVLATAFSPDGARVVTGCSGGTVRIWDATTGVQLGRPLQHEKDVWGVAFSPDGSRVITASDDGTARIWDATSGKQLRSLQHNETVWTATFSPDGGRIVTASGRNDFSLSCGAKLWNPSTGDARGLPLQHAVGCVRAASFSSDGTRVVTAGSDSTARIWDAFTGSPLGAPLVCGSRLQDVRFSPDGSRIVTADFFGTVRIWDTATATQLGQPLQHDGETTSASFSPDGARIVTTGFDRSAHLWDAATGSPLSRPLRHGQLIWTAAFSPDGTRVVTASEDNTARIWNVLETGTLSAWVSEARQCIAPRTSGSHVICPLAQHPPSPSNLVSRIRSVVLVGDAATFSGVWSVAREDYQRALALLGDGSVAQLDAQPGRAQAWRLAVSFRLAMLDAVEGQLAAARARLGTDAPATDALLLNSLGTTAHDELHNDRVSLRLLQHAHTLDPTNASILGNLTEAYFATRDYDAFTRSASKLARLRPSPDVRVAVAAMTWAAARLLRQPSGSAGVQLLRAYNQRANDAHIGWTWAGTEHALRYHSYTFDEVKPVLDVLHVLAKNVTAQTRTELARLVQPPGLAPAP